MNKILKRKNLYIRSQVGQAALTFVLALISTAVLLVGALSVLTFNEVKKLNNIEKSAESYYAAEAGVEDAILRVKNQMNYTTSYSINVGSGSAAVSMSGPLENLTIISEGDVSSRVRKVEVNLIASPSDTDVNFNYGVQVGDGGLFMENTATIVGSVYSNGDITSNNNPSITGDAFAAGTSVIDGRSYPGQPLDIDGSAQARVIRDTRVGGNAEAYELFDCEVGGWTYYDLSYNNCTVSAPSQQTYTNLDSLSMPISDAQLDTWEQEAEAGGVISGPCPYEPSNGESLGPVKITCDLLINDNQVITMTGAIWVVGDMTISNQSIIRLASSFGDKSSHIIIDDPADRLTSSKFIIQNDAQIQGSGDPDSFVMVASRNNSYESGGSETAILISNKTNAPIYYAPHGSLLIENNTDLYQATAYRLHLKNSGQVTYQSGLADAIFTSGPGGTFKVLSWKEIE